MRITIMTMTMTLAAAAVSLCGATCGTVAAPLTCTVNVGVNLLYTFGGFSVSAASGSHIYTGADIAIDVATGGGNTGLLTFSKVVNANGSSFLANPGESSSFTFTYTAAVSAVNPGTAAFGTPGIVNIGQANANGTGLGAVQMLLLNPPNATSCQAFINSASTTQGVCNALPPGTTNVLTVGDIVTLSAGNGTGTNNVGVLSFSNLLSATFSAAPAGGDVPEPSTWVTLGIGLAGIATIKAGRGR
ncbi:MAG: PEP-CTERM sorting domain-containing protein [Acidobacteria bacterium]|nr:PEP-CTERM sorting domain-containing protein [Acidobacteriota bacterium]